MHKVSLYTCDGCQQVFRPEDLRKGRIGPHTWTPSAASFIGLGPWHSTDPVVSTSEEDCRVKMTAWQHDEATYHQQHDAAIRQRQIDEDRIVADCRTDALLRQLLESGNTELARHRVHQLAADLHIDWDVVTYDSSLWSTALLQRCFAEAGED